MHYAEIKNFDIANGEGIRVSLFVSGCPHHCRGCFNQEAWDENYGNKFGEKEENEILELLKPDYIQGLTLLGGEPMWPKNQEGLLPLLRKVKEEYPEKNIWCYTGYLFDKEIMEKMVRESHITKELLTYIDVLVDGRFVESLLNRTLYFRGSSNQRIIDVQESLKQRKLVEYKMKKEGEKVNV
ncbi:MAG: anaerobic ribonucleoside-triphosphate reductase activating protein [Bacilli bacterium]|nr:anaerobic ribonucleoside-triphosphate reductase activating protein [Bacilli bacterium]